MIQDFADWLSPMLVKELRQGMRSRVLTSSLFILQGLLIFNVIIAFTVAENGNDTQSVTTFFWTILSLPLLMILPLSALGSVGNEIKNNTLELIFLTRLNAWRIVFGKWIAIVTQAALLAVTVLPYIALRYYLGGVNMLNDLLTVGAILVVSAVLTAVTVGVSPYQSKIIRIFLFLGYFFLLQVGGSFVAVLLMGGGSRGVLRGVGLPSGVILGGIALLLPILILLMLGMAASRIAPLAENHAGPRRLLALLILLVCGVASLFAVDAEWLIIVGQVAITPICLGALSENEVALSSLYRPFVKRGFLGRFAARFFTPGWNTGFYFTMLVLAILGVFWWKAGWFNASTASPYRYVSLIAFAATLLLPPALTPRSIKKRWMPYLILFTSSGLVIFVLSIIGGVAHSHILQASVILPPIGIFAPAFDDFGGFGKMLTLWMSFLAAVSLILLLVKSRAPFRSLKTLLAEASRSLPNHDA
ncbi:MAG: hypothetical protein ABIT76_04135 [Chthoniobacterales bacterium]